MLARALNAVLAALLGAALAVGGAIAAIEILLGIAGNGPTIVPYRDWRATLERHTWADGGVRGIALLLCLAGLALLALQFVRLRARQVELQTGRAEVEAAVGRRSLERSLARTVEDVEGVSAASVALRRNRLQVRASALEGPSDALRGEIGGAIAQRLSLLRPVREPQVSVSVRRHRP